MPIGNSMVIINLPRIRRWMHVMHDVRDRQLPFYMGAWFSDFSRPGDPSTPACALGWAARDPQLKQEGLRIGGDGTRATVCYRSVTGSRAAALFFGLPPRAVSSIVHYGSYHSELGMRNESSLRRELLSMITAEHVIAHMDKELIRLLGVSA